MLVGLLVLPFHWVVQRELARQSDPAYLRQRGVVIVSLNAIEAHSEPVGTYAGREIWGTLTFKGMVYRFDRIVAPQERERIGAGELYVEPGLVFRARHS